MKFTAQQLAQKFYDIPIAMTVLDGKVYAAYIGDWKAYDLPYTDPVVAQSAIEQGLFNKQETGEIAGKPVTWYRNVRA